MKTNHESRGYCDFWDTVKTTRFELTPENTAVCSFSNRYPLKTTEVAQWLRDEKREFVLIDLCRYNHLNLFMVARRQDVHQFDYTGIPFSTVAQDLKSFHGFQYIKTAHNEEIYDTRLHCAEMIRCIDTIITILPKPPRRGTRFLKKPIDIKAQTSNDRSGFYKIHRSDGLTDCHNYGDCSMILSVMAIYLC